MRIFSSYTRTLCLLALATQTLAVLVSPTTDTPHTSSSPYTTDTPTQHGWVRGVVGEDGVTQYHGVPFAAPPTKDQRWKKPSPPSSWDSVLDTTSKDVIHVCPQIDVIKGFHVGNEDCLSLSIYVPPQCTNSTPCPVMQWIHGGAWMFGANNFGNNYNAVKLAKRGVVVVAANYRLDVFGWLTLKELGIDNSDTAFSNFGLMDQQFGLKWTQSNIASFGGDPNHVTLFGESAGGFSVCQHIVMPESNGLFSRAIMESGDCDGPFLIRDKTHALEFGDKYADAVGCKNTSSSNERLECLRQLPLEDVMIPYVRWFCHVIPAGTSPWCADYDSHTHPGIVSPMAPVAGWTAVVDGIVLPESPLDMIKKGQINKGPNGESISIIFGTDEDEMAYFVFSAPIVFPSIEHTLPVSNQSFTEIVQFLAPYHGWNRSTANQIVSFYPTEDYPTEAYRLNVFGTDLLFRCGTRNAAKALAEQGLDVYMYHFNFHFNDWKDPKDIACELIDESNCGVYHGSELPFVFSHEISGDKELGMAEIMGTYWTNMAIHGSPNSPSRSLDSPSRLYNSTSRFHNYIRVWPKYTVSSEQHLEFTPEGSTAVKEGLRATICDKYDSLPIN